MSWMPLICVLSATAPGVEAASIGPALEANPETFAKIKELGPNQARIIGKAKVMGDFNDTAKRYELPRTGPRGRDCTIRMVWAPERRRVLFYAHLPVVGVPDHPF